MGSAVSNYILFTIENITRRCGLSPSFLWKNYLYRTYVWCNYDCETMYL